MERRFISVRYPLKAKELCTRKLAKRTICGVTVLASVFNVPRFFGYEIKHCGEEHYEKVSSNFEASSSFSAMTWFYISTVHFLPYILLIYLNTGLIITVLRALKQRTTLHCISRNFKSFSVSSSHVLPITSVGRTDKSTSKKISKVLTPKVEKNICQMIKRHRHHNFRFNNSSPHWFSQQHPSINSINQIKRLNTNEDKIPEKSSFHDPNATHTFRCLHESRPRTSCSSMLMPELRGNSVRLGLRKFTNFDFSPFTHNMSCMSLPEDIKLNRVSVLYQGGSTRSNHCHHHQHFFRRPNCFSHEQMRMTVTCISIICLFLLCIIPSAFSNRPIAKALFGRGATMIEFTRGRFYNRLRTVTNFLVYCNLSLNFVLYCVFNHRFLVTLRRLVHLRLQNIVSTCATIKSKSLFMCNVLSRCRLSPSRHDMSSSHCGAFVISSSSINDCHVHPEVHIESIQSEPHNDIWNSFSPRRMRCNNFRRNQSERGNFCCRFNNGVIHASGCHSE